MITTRFFSDLSLRVLLIPESDDVEESTKNAKEAARILTVDRILILVTMMLILSFSLALWDQVFANLTHNLKILLSFVMTILIFIISALSIYFIPEGFLKSLVVVPRTLNWFIKRQMNLSSKLMRVFNVNITMNGNGHSDETSNELEVFEAAGLSVDVDEMKMIKGILKMDVVRTREIMKPRVDLITIPLSSNLKDVAELISTSGYSKIPVVGDSIDEVKGIIYAKDALKIHDSQASKFAIADMMRPAIFVPESQNLEQLLSEFQKRRTRIAIVMDEHGGVSGLVTVTDLIEEIVGELNDEFDQPYPSIHRINENNLIIDAKVSISDLNKEIGSSIQINGYDTIGGLVYKELGKMPVVGDTVNFNDLEIVIQSTVGRRIGRLRVRIL